MEVAIYTNKVAYCRWQEDGNGANWRDYRRAKIKTRGPKGEKEIDWLVRVHEYQGKDTDRVASVKDKDGKVL